MQKTFIAQVTSQLNKKLVTNKYIASVVSIIAGSEKLMPQCVICSGCKFVLYEGQDLKPPDEILQQHEGKCPKCGKKLSLLPIDVEVKPMK